MKFAPLPGSDAAGNWVRRAGLVDFEAGQSSCITNGRME
jgi:hypothetical protein